MIACHADKAARLRWSEMVMTRSRTRRTIVQERAPGMARFFSPSNLDRYRKLASGMIGQAEQHQLLEDLAQEMNAFKREALADASRRAAETSILSRSRERM